MSSTPLKSNCVSMSVSSARRDPGWLFFSTRAYFVSSDVNWKPLQHEFGFLVLRHYLVSISGGNPYLQAGFQHSRCLHGLVVTGDGRAQCEGRRVHGYLMVCEDRCRRLLPGLLVCGLQH